MQTSLCTVPDEFRISKISISLSAKVETEKRGIKVNEYMQSVSNPTIYAAGDAAASGGPPLTPVAGYEGRMVAENLLKGNHLKAQYVAIPTVAFTIPPLASVGMSENSARERKLKFRTNRDITSSWYSSRRVAEDCSGFKVLIEEGSDRIFGAHLLGPHAEEVINLFALAMRSEVRATVLRDALLAYPTISSDLRRSSLHVVVYAGLASMGIEHSSSRTSWALRTSLEFQNGSISPTGSTVHSDIMGELQQRTTRH